MSSHPLAWALGSLWRRIAATLPYTLALHLHPSLGLCPSTLVLCALCVISIYGLPYMGPAPAN